MKAIYSKRIYDTRKAEKILDFGDMTLYRTKNGRWFLTDAFGVQPCLYPVEPERAAVYVGMYAAERYGEFFPMSELEEA